jgi:hypothetical protein
MNLITGIIAVAIGGIYLVTAMLLRKCGWATGSVPNSFRPWWNPGDTSGLVLVIQERKPERRSKKADFGFVTHRQVWIKILLTTVVGIAYALVMDSLGFLIPTTLFMLFISTLSTGAGWSRISYWPSPFR